MSDPHQRVIRGERLVDDTPHVRVSLADVELPNQVRFTQYVFKMRRSAMTVVLDEPVGVVSGLVQVLLSSGRPVLRRGETLLASRRGIDGWRNMGESDAQCLWVLQD